MGNWVFDMQVLLSEMQKLFEMQSFCISGSET